VADRKTPVIGVAGWKKSGKTTLAVRLVEEFTRRGYKVGTVKHAHHEFQIDDVTTDSARHRQAGSAEVCVVGGKRWAMIHELRGEPEPNLEEVLSWLSPADLHLVEGYKSAAIPKIEVRAAIAFTKTPLWPEDPLVLAVASDQPEPGCPLPIYSRDDIGGLADMITQAIGPLDKRFGSMRQPGAPKQHVRDDEARKRDP
jgi:molybdopterin-guanine dinucleotide biosynthesis adapter protein